MWPTEAPTTPRDERATSGRSGAVDERALQEIIRRIVEVAQPERIILPDDPREWLNRARSNLAIAKSETPGVYLEDLCFDAQQAAEKAIKALLIHRGVKFPHVHDIAVLVTLLENAGDDIPAESRNAGQLSRFATFAQYPGARPVSDAEYKQAVAVAEAVVRWVEQRLRAG